MEDMRCPGLYQGAIDAEMLFTERVSFARQLNHFFKQGGDDVVRQKTVAVFAEGGVIPYLVINAQTESQ